MPSTTKRPIQAEDLYQLQTLTECEISPDGQWVLFCVGRVDRQSERKYSNLWLVNTADGQMRQFTIGDQYDSHPRWSPGGGRTNFRTVGAPTGILPGSRRCAAGLIAI